MAEHRAFPHTIDPPSRNARDPAKVQPSAQYQSRCGLLSQTGLVPGPQPQYWDIASRRTGHPDMWYTDIGTIWQEANPALGLDFGRFLSAIPGAEPTGPASNLAYIYLGGSHA